MIKFFSIIALFICSGVNVFATETTGVISTIQPITSLVSAVIGNTGKSITIIPSEQSPHDFKLKPSDVKVLQNGNIGIGTTSPSEPLEVVGVISSADSGLQKSTFSNVGNDLVLVANAGKTNVSANLLFKSSVSGGNTTEKLRIDTSGAMQFGTGTNNAGFIDFDGTSVQINTQRNPNTGVFVDTGKSNASINLVGAAGASYIRFNTATGNNTTATEKVRITDTGRVGIGTNDPSTLLTLTDGAIPYSGTNILLQIKRDKAVQDFLNKIRLEYEVIINPNLKI